MPEATYTVYKRTPDDISDERPQDQFQTSINTEATPSVKIIVPDLEFQFELPSHLNDAQLRDPVRNKIEKHLKENPHKVNLSHASRSTDWEKIKKSNSSHQLTLLSDTLEGSTRVMNGIRVEIEDHPAGKIKYIAPVLLVTLVFMAPEFGGAYLQTLVTEVNLPGEDSSGSTINITSKEKALAWVTAGAGIAQTLVGYLAYQTLQNIDYLSRKMVDAYRKKEYNLRDDFELPSKCQSLLLKFKENPIKIVVISTIFVSIFALMSFSMIMDIMVAYSQQKTSLIEAYNKKMTSMALDPLLKFNEILYVLGAGFAFLLSLEGSYMAAKSANRLYDAISGAVSHCRFPFSGKGTADEHSALLGDPQSLA